MSNVTCKDCLCCNKCSVLDYEMEYHNKSTIEVLNQPICKDAMLKNEWIKLPLSLDDRENLEKVLNNLYLWLLFPTDCENCPKTKVEFHNCCQELCDLYHGKHNKYSPIQDLDFMCDNCPLEIVKVEFTTEKYERAVKCKNGEIKYDVSDLICFLSEKECRDKLKEIRPND